MDSRQVYRAVGRDLDNFKFLVSVMFQLRIDLSPNLGGQHIQMDGAEVRRCMHLF